MCLSTCPSSTPPVHLALHPIFNLLQSSASAVGINLREARIHFLPLQLRSLSVLRSSVQSLCAQAHVHVMFEGCAHAHGLPHEAFGLALVERGHDLFAAWIKIVRIRAGFEEILLGIPTDIVLGVKVRMHDCWRM